MSTVSNSSIAGSRIINCIRSPNAVIVIPITLHISFLKEEKFTAFQNAMKTYVREQTRSWEKLIFLIKSDVDADNEKVVATLAFGHRNSWQDAGRILVHKGNLLKFIHETLLFTCIPPSSLQRRNACRWAKWPWGLQGYTTQSFEYSEL